MHPTCGAETQPTEVLATAHARHVVTRAIFNFLHQGVAVRAPLAAELHCPSSWGTVADHAHHSSANPSEGRVQGPPYGLSLTGCGVVITFAAVAGPPHAAGSSALKEVRGTPVEIQGYFGVGAVGSGTKANMLHSNEALSQGEVEVLVEGSLGRTGLHFVGKNTSAAYWATKLNAGLCNLNVKVANETFVTELVVARGKNLCHVDGFLLVANWTDESWLGLRGRRRVHGTFPPPTPVVVRQNRRTANDMTS